MYGVAGYGKSEVDHAGGLAKVAVRKQVTAGALFMSAGEMVEFLTEKFQDKINPNYYIKEVPSYLLNEKRGMAHLIAHPTIDGSSNFQVMVFRPDLIEFKAAERLCICFQCQESYGLSNLFSYQIRSHQLNKVHLRSQLTESLSSSHDDEGRYDFIIPQMYVAVAADDNSLDSMWFIKVLEVECCGNGKYGDDYGNIIPVGVDFIKGHFMEKSVFSNSKYQTYKLSRKVTLFYKESVVYPYVNSEQNKKGFILKMDEYAEILNFVERNSYNQI